MKNNFKLFSTAIAAIITIGSVSLVSCDKVDENVSANLYQQSKNSQSGLQLSNSNRENLARAIAIRFGQNDSVYRELNHAIHAITRYGLDENLKLFDILHPEKSVFLDTTVCIANIRYAVGPQNPFTEFGFSENNFYGDLQFYWPYHDEWDRTTTPIVCFAPENEHANEVTGFRYEKGTVDTVTVTAESIDMGAVAVVIINQSETHYTEYPNFKKGLWTKDGVTWVIPWPIKPVNPAQGGAPSVDKVYEARTSAFTSSGIQYDFVWAGGSEFELQSAYTTDASNVKVTTRARIEFTRKEIKNRVTKNFGAVLHENWQPGLGEIHIRLIEDDGWGAVMPVVLDINVAGSTLSTTINGNSADDVVFDARYTRSNYFNRCYNDNGIFDFGSERVRCILDVYDSYGD